MGSGGEVLMRLCFIEGDFGCSCEQVHLFAGLLHVAFDFLMSGFMLILRRCVTSILAGNVTSAERAQALSSFFDRW